MHATIGIRVYQFGYNMHNDLFVVIPQRVFVQQIPPRTMIYNKGVVAQ